MTSGLGSGSRAAGSKPCWCCAGSRTAARSTCWDAGISAATAYRYLHEAIDVIAEQGADLDEVLAVGK